MTNFGASLRKARESKGITLDQIAIETRISTRLLRAIENEEFHLLPGGIFNRGFVRSFAEKVGLDPDQAVADYERLAEVREPPVDAQATPTAAPKKSGWHLYSIALVILAAVIVIFYVVNRESSRIVQTAPPPPSQVQAPAATPTPAVTTQPTPPATAPKTTAAAPEPAPLPLPAAAQALTLRMEATGETWIKVTTDGKAADPGEILEPGMTRTFTAQNAINLVIGNAGGVAMKINDQPVKPLGKSGQVRELNITPDNLKSLL